MAAAVLKGPCSLTDYREKVIPTEAEQNLVPQSVRLINEREFGGKYPVKQPVFQTQKIMANTSLKDGKPALLGTANVPPPVEYAVNEKDQTVWLDFITVHLIRL